jgi:glycosyltransferase involved in cell wall biosynthesis
MSSFPLVSIALCTYNGAVFLAEQLDSLLSQTYPNLEIIIVDDGSTDDTIGVLKRYSANAASIRLYQNQLNLGYIKNFEKAISLCSGEWIALCDQDDIWHSDKITLMMTHAGSHMLIYHDSEFIDETGEPLHKKISDIRNCYSGGDSRVFLFENCVSGHALLFRKELLTYFDGFHQLIMHDWWLAYIALNAGTILYLDRILVKYRQHSKANTNILRQNRGEKKADSLDKIRKQLNLIAIFASYPYNKEQLFKAELLRLMEKRMGSYLSIDLALFVWKYRVVLLYIQKKSGFSKMNFILKFIWGFKIKSIFSRYQVGHI